MDSRGAVLSCKSRHRRKLEAVLSAEYVLIDDVLAYRFAV
jgi:hypothetical protein